MERSTCHTALVGIARYRKKRTLKIIGGGRKIVQVQIIDFASVCVLIRIHTDFQGVGVPSSAVVVSIPRLGLRNKRRPIFESIHPTCIEFVKRVGLRVESGRCHHAVEEYTIDPRLGPWSVSLLAQVQVALQAIEAVMEEGSRG